MTLITDPLNFPIQIYSLSLYKGIVVSTLNVLTPQHFQGTISPFFINNSS